MANNWETILRDSKLPDHMVKLATCTLKSLVDSAIEDNIPPKVFNKYVELFGATMLLIANDLVQKYISGELHMDEDTGYISVDFDNLNA